MITNALCAGIVLTRPVRGKYMGNQIYKNILCVMLTLFFVITLMSIVEASDSVNEENNTTVSMPHNVATPMSYTLGNSSSIFDGSFLSDLINKYQPKARLNTSGNTSVKSIRGMTNNNSVALVDGSAVATYR